jgi:hypothetical protein
MSKEFFPGVLSLVYPSTFFCHGEFSSIFFFANDEFISKGENDMKRNKRPSREIVVRWRFLGEKSGFVRIYAGWKMERWKMETQKRRKTMKAKNRN